jgi:protein-disulfide isomerase
VAQKSKRPARPDLKNPDGRFGRLIQIGGTAIVVIFAVGLVAFIVKSGHDKKVPPAPDATGRSDTVRVTSGKLVTKPGTADPKAVVLIYEDFLCPICGDFERAMGPTVSKLIDIGAIAADYSPVAILDNRPGTQHYSSRAGAAALCVADESIDAFRRFHNHLFDKGVQPAEDGTTPIPDNARLIEIAREAGAAGKVPDCINSGKYIAKLLGAADAAHIDGTPTILINGQRYYPSTPEDLVAKVKAIVGDVPGIDTAVAPAQS